MEPQNRAVMFTNISWSSYLLFVAILLVIWYFVVGIRYYFAELQAIASGKIKFFRHKVYPEEQSDTRDRAEDYQLATDAAPAADMEALSSKLNEAVTSAAVGNYGREEFLFMLQLTLKEFPGPKEASFRLAIDELIFSECEKQGVIRPSDHELKLLWSEVA